jgi:hypothetical protein
VGYTFDKTCHFEYIKGRSHLGGLGTDERIILRMEYANLIELA